MKMLEKHLNLTYGIVSIIALIFGALAVTQGSAVYYVLYVAIVYVCGFLILWRKDRLSDNKFYFLFLVPPLFTLSVLLAKNERNDEVKAKLKKLGV